jgi:tRNA (guanine-N7-)-methyltransferase
MVKAKEFHIPFTWEKRHVVIKDRVWFMPPRIPEDPFVFAGWNHPELFGQERPVRIEYCSGNGGWICEKAKNDPNSNWLAVEMQFCRARLIWARAKNANLDNVGVAFAEGFELTQRFIPTASVEEVFINFPDPWPKRRHAKHRIVRSEFISELARIIKPTGIVTLVTDDEDYSKIMTEQMHLVPAFKSEFGPPFFQEASKEYGDSFFDSLFRNLSKIIRLHRYVRL